MSCNSSEALTKAGLEQWMNKDYVGEFAGDELIDGFLQIVVNCEGCPSAALGQDGCRNREDISEVAVIRGLDLPDGFEDKNETYHTRRRSL